MSSEDKRIYKAKFIKSVRCCSRGRFIVSLEDGSILTCFGVAPGLKSGMPLIIEGIPIDGNGDAINTVRFYLDAGNRAAMITFFCGRVFPKINKQNAPKVYDALALLATELKTTITYIPRDQADKKLRDIIKDKTARDKLINVLSSMGERHSLYEVIEELGGSIGDTENLFNVYGGYALDMLRENPYVGVKCGLSFNICDRIFKEKLNGKTHSHIRVEALLKQLSAKIRQSGSCCMELGEALTELQTMQKEGVFPDLPRAFFLCALGATTRFRMEEDEKYGMLLYPSASYHTEVNIARELFRLESKTQQNGKCVDQDKEGLDEDQAKAIQLIETTGIKIITGGPGTGKTTIIDRLISIYKRIQPKNTVILAAPTGKAAVRINETSEEACATTIHKLLGMRPIGDKEDMKPDFDKSRPLPKGLFIIDEMSMVDEYTFLDLLQAIPEGSTVVLSGDPLQLPSVQAGTILKDLQESGQFPIVRLTHIHRQDGGTIVQNYQKIVSKDPILFQDESFHIIQNTHNEIIKSIEKLYQKFKSGNEGSFQILTPTRVGTLGRDNINEIIAAKEHSNTKTKTYTNTKFATEDRVMMTRNNYPAGYWNGDTGVIQKILDDGVSVKFYDGVRRIKREDFVDMEYAFACTVHKSQGSEYDRIAIVLDDRYPNMLYNAMILTAITRAKKEVWIFQKGDSLKKAILRDTGNMRITGLNTMIQHFFTENHIHSKEEAL